MGQHLTVVSGDIATSLQSVLDASPSYRHQLRQLLHQYQSDPSLSAAQILQWSGEKLVADATNETHEIGARFLPMLAKIDLGKLDASTVTQCIAQAAMQYLEGRCGRTQSSRCARRTHREWLTHRRCSTLIMCPPLPFPSLRVEAGHEPSRSLSVLCGHRQRREAAKDPSIRRPQLPERGEGTGWRRRTDNELSRSLAESMHLRSDVCSVSCVSCSSPAPPR